MQSNSRPQAGQQRTAVASDEELSEEWWQACYVAGNCDDALQTAARSVAVCAPAGGGKTTALAAAQRALATTALVVVIDAQKTLARPPAPEDREPPTPLQVLMRAACAAVQRQIETDPAAAANLSNLQGQFLGWALRKYVRARARDLWLERLGHPQVTELVAAPSEELYPDERDSDYVTGQIDELVHLAAGLGRERVVVLLDVQQEPMHGGWTLLEEMFGWLELWQNPGFMLKAVLPPAVAEQGKLRERARGRVVFRLLEWNADQHNVIAARRLSYWSGAAVELRQALAPSALEQMTGTVDDIFGGLTPRSAVSLAETIRDLWPARDWPVEAAQLVRLQRELYRRYAPLRLDKHGVWRGERFIAISGAPYRALEALWNAGEDSSGWDVLRNVAGSDGNVHTLVKRLRQAVEPLPGDPLYVCKESGETYRLEKNPKHP